jgi:CDP-glucose 4,6-dehydratase
MTSFGGIYAGRRVLVTGHTGFLGLWITTWLRALDAHVLGLSRRLPEAGGGWATVQSAVADVRDASGLARVFEAFGPEIIVHAAAQPLVARGWSAPAETFDVNVMGTVNVLEAARATHTVRTVIVLVSSRDERVRGADPYNLSKHAAELVASLYADPRMSDGRPRSLAVGVARPGVVIGGGDWAHNRLIPDVMRALMSGEPPQVRTGSSIRPWQHALEAVSGCLAFAAQLTIENRPPRIDYSFGLADSSDALTVAELVELLQYMWAGERPQKHVAGVVNGDGYLIGCRDAEHDLGWRPAWNVEAAALRTVEWYRTFRERPDELPPLAGAQIDAYVADARQAGIAWAARA